MKPSHHDLNVAICSNCLTEFEYFIYCISIPTICTICQRKLNREKSKKINKYKKICVPVSQIKIRDEKLIEEKSKITNINKEAIVNVKRSEGISGNLIGKYGDIKKVTEQLKKT